MRIKWNQDWSFSVKGDPVQTVTLPHSAKVESPYSADMWMGVCVYKKTIDTSQFDINSLIRIHFEGAMHDAKVFVDGQWAGSHQGGYTPFSVNLTPHLKPGNRSEVSVVLDNRYDESIPPAKPLHELDFKWYHGLYRNVWLETSPVVHITCPFDERSGGQSGVRLHHKIIDGDVILEMSAEIENVSEAEKFYDIDVKVKPVSRGASEVKIHGEVTKSGVLQGREKSFLTWSLRLEGVSLWDIENPNLYDLQMVLQDDQGLEDQCVKRLGFRSIAFSRSKGFEINGVSKRLRGTNRHQEYPWIGYALSDASQKRDAKRIKDAGFDYVRLSHYPQSPAFLQACDELGIVVMTCLPGWQYFGSKAFQKACFENARSMIRRDHHHPSIVLWEFSLNETEMEDEFMSKMAQIPEEELPGGKLFTCGWLDRYDVYIRSRQHGQLHTWQNGDKALVVAEYGDWEYYARNDGFDQDGFGNLLPEELNSRKTRMHGGEGLLQQAKNHEEALNENYSTVACLDGQWAMFDYVRGYHDEQAYVGVMDIHRYPKFSYHMYRSQRDVEDDDIETMVLEVASFDQRVLGDELIVYSNLEQVMVYVGDQLQEPLMGKSEFLPHPPLRYVIKNSEKELILLIGYHNGKMVKRLVIEKGKSAKVVELEVEEAGVSPSQGDKDQVFMRAKCLDEDGTLDTSYHGLVTLVTRTPGLRIYPNLVVRAEAGIASYLLESDVGFGQKDLNLTAELIPEQIDMTEGTQLMLSADKKIKGL